MELSGRLGVGGDGEELTTDPNRVTEVHFPYFTIWHKARWFMVEEGKRFKNVARQLLVI